MADEKTHGNVKYEPKDIHLRWIVAMFVTFAEEIVTPAE